MSDEETTTTEQTQTYDEKMLKAVEAVLEGRITDEYKTLKIANREITKYSFDELLCIREYFRKIVTQQRIAKQGKFKSYRYKF